MRVRARAAVALRAAAGRPDRRHPSRGIENRMNDTRKAWQCIGCGRIEAPQPCIGICQDRKVEFVYAPEHRETVAQLALARRQVDVMETIVRRLA